MNRLRTHERVSMRLAILFLTALVVASCRGDEVDLIDSGSEERGVRVFYRGQPATNGTIRLDANNGFFDRGAFVAEGKHAAPSETEQALIHFHYDHLVTPRDPVPGTARWYLWLPSSGELSVKIHMDVPESEDGVRWVVKLDQQQRQMVAKTSTKESSQDWNLSFKISRPGKHKISLEQLDRRRNEDTRVYSINLSGEAIQTASVIRARWRPAAAHTQYVSSTCPKTRMWVIETQNVSDFASYSPINTPFGYFGGSLSSDRRAAGNLNFSMWAANSSATSAPPLTQMPHLLATGHPEAEFGGFGHEGSGVKIRNWEPLSHHPTSIVQGLRMDVHNETATYSGYVFDDRVSQWKLYAVGRRPLKQSNKRKGAPTEPPSLRISSFCEIPGPASRQRTGDRRRIIRRRGWVCDEAGTWHAIDRQTRNAKNAFPINQYIDVDDGWFVMATGGVEMFPPTASQTTLTSKTQPLPMYLNREISKQLRELPVVFGPHVVAEITRNSAVVEYSLADAGKDAKAILYYGTQDCLSFIRRESFHATEKKGVIDKMFSRDRTWQSATPATEVHTGKNSFKLTSLEKNTTYFYRLFVKNEAGKIWSFEAGKFTTNQ